MKKGLQGSYSMLCNRLYALTVEVTRLFLFRQLFDNLANRISRLDMVLSNLV